MRKRDFEGLLQSIREGGAILRGEMEPSRRYSIQELLGPERFAIWEARHRSGLTQAAFAQLLGVSPRTLQQWEQGRRKPSGAARTLIHVMAAEPETIIKTMERVNAVREPRVRPASVIRVAKRRQPKTVKHAGKRT
jgi:putative transcriptional regulator